MTGQSLCPGDPEPTSMSAHSRPQSYVMKGWLCFTSLPEKHPQRRTSIVACLGCYRLGFALYWVTTTGITKDLEGLSAQSYAEEHGLSPIQALQLNSFLKGWRKEKRPRLWFGFWGCRLLLTSSDFLSSLGCLCQMGRFWNGAEGISVVKTSR